MASKRYAAVDKTIWIPKHIKNYFLNFRSFQILPDCPDRSPRHQFIWKTEYARGNTAERSTPDPAGFCQFQTGTVTGFQHFYIFFHNLPPPL